MRLKLENTLLWMLIVFLPVQTAKHFWPSFSFINGLRIDYLSPALYLTDLIVLPLLLIIPPRLPSLSKKVVFLLLLLMLNIVFSLSPLLTVYKYLRILLYLLLSLRLIHSWNIVEKILPYALSIAVLWTSFLIFCQFFTQGSVGMFWQYLGERPLSPAALNIAKISLGNMGLYIRPYATFPHPNALAGFLVVSFWILFYYVSRVVGNFKPCRLILLSMAISVPALFLTFSRSAIIIFLISLLFVFRLKKKNYRVYFLSILAFSVLAVYYFLNIGSVTSLPERIYLLQKSYSVILQHPLFGVGMGNFPLAGYLVGFNNPFLFYQPVHNVFILFLVETGIPVFLLFCFILFKFIKHQVCKSDLYLRIAFFDVLFLSLIDHYWMTSVSNLILLSFLLSLVIVRSGTNANQK
jgi:O-antigen ligase